MLKSLLPAGLEVSRLHWGGGTPTLLPPDAVRRLAAAIASVLPLAKDAEFSVEIDPDQVDEARLDALIEVGMTRASLGVQDFDPEIQAAIGRIQPFALTQTVVEQIRARGIKSLNIDLVYGLPCQTRARMVETVQKVLSLRPERLALYGYAHVPWMARRQQLIPTENLPSPEERLALFETARRLLVWEGYREIGIDHFALADDGLARAAAEGRLHRNFQGYTDDAAPVLLGLGASAISRLPQGYAQMDPSTGSFSRAVRAGRVPIVRGHAFRGEDLLRGQIIEALMCDFSVRFEDLSRRFGLTPARWGALMRPVAERFGAFVKFGPEALVITPEGRPLTRMIAACFDEYLSDAKAFSLAI